MAEELLSGHDLRGLIDPGYAWKLRWDRWVANEALRVSGVGGLQDTRTLELDAFGMSEVDGRPGYGTQCQNDGDRGCTR